MSWLIVALAASAAETSITLRGEVPDDGLDHLLEPFEVPEGIAELAVAHDDGSEANILDWGLNDPAGFRGWGGGNHEGVVINAAAATRSYLPGPIAAGTWQLVIGKAKIARAPATYEVTVTLRDVVTLPAQPERRAYAHAAPLAAEPRWYTGDLHVHSRESGDAAPSLDEIGEAALAAGLDFVVITDHNTTSHLSWLADAQARFPTLLFVPGVEWTSYQGHANGLGATAWVDHKLGQPGVTVDGVAAGFRAQGAVMSINHPDLDLGEACIGCAWEHELAPSSFGAVEIVTGGWRPVGRLFAPAAIARWEGWLDRGARLTPVGGSDDHRAGEDDGPFASPIGSPSTRVWAEELSVPAILDGLRAGRTVVQTQSAAGPWLSYREALPGEELIDPAFVTARVEGAGAGTLQWVVDGEVVEEVVIDADPFEHAVAVTSGGRLRAQVLAADGELSVVAGHLWLAHAVPPDAGACGCGGRSPSSLGLLALLLLRRRRLTPSA